ncbi:competence type IV pilus assembly protein ComGB [Carnobacterium mobile]|nr:competence type IV pilus assembly protein ComGB [Carnobacterium mobile]
MVLLLKKIFKNTKSHKVPLIAVQASFLMKLASLIQEGFTLREALLFLATIMPKENQWIQIILKQLENGERFDEIIKSLGFSERVSTQVYLSLIHGRFAEALYSSGQYLDAKNKQKKQLFRLLQYPLVLMVFMIGILIAMRLVLLPNFQQLYDTSARNLSWINRFAIGFIEEFPTILLISGLVCLLIFILIFRELKRWSAIKQATFYMKIPLASNLLRLYYTHFFSYEWSQLLKSGYQMNAIIELMQAKETTALMREVASIMEEKLKSGLNFKESMSEWPFFNKELGLIILHGEATSQLASELAIYAEDCQERMVHQLQKMLGWIQPFIFLLVAFFILCIYLALLLPSFSMMEGIV